MKRLFSKKSSGFALILSLSLMALTLLFVLSISTALRQQLILSSTEITKKNARQTSLLALKDAIASIQKNVGIDTVSTSTSSIVHENKNWSGVWDSNGKLVDWLVSSAKNQDPISSFKQNKSVKIKSFLNSSGDKEFVYTPIKELKNENNTTIGRYSWWVSDESVKAKINAVDKSYQHGNQNTLKLPLKVGLELGGDSLGGLFETNNEAYSKLSKKVFSYKQISNILKDEDDLDKYTHDFTTYSYGVIADSKNGGLRKDLSIGLGHPTNSIKGPIFKDSSGKDSWQGFGPDWELIDSYLNLRSDQNMVAARPHRSNDSGLPEMYFFHDRPSNVQHGVYPLVARFQMYFYPTWIHDGTGLRLRMFQVPTIVLWNPYDVAIAAQDYVMLLHSAMEQTSSDTYYFRLQYEVLDLAGNPLSSPIQGDFPDFIYKDKKLQNRFDTEVGFRLNSERIEPGQAVVFSLNSNQARSTIMDMYPLPYEGYGFYEDSLNTVTLPTGNVNDYTVRVHSEAPVSNTLFLGYRLHLDSPYTDTGTQLHSTDAVRISPGMPSAFGGTKYVLDPVLCRDDTALTVVSPEIMDINLSEYKFFGIETILAQPEIDFKWSNRDHDNRSPSRIFGNYNLRAPFAPLIGSHHISSNYIAALGEVRFYGRSIFNSQYTYGQNFPTQRSEPATTYIGFSESPTTADRAILYHILDKDEVVHSIGQLRHCNLSDIYASPNQQISSSKPSSFLNERYAIANSLIDLSSAKLRYTYKNNEQLFPLGDWSYKANESLWDQYFFSTISKNENYENGIKNPRLYHIKHPGPQNKELEDYNKVASHLFINGAFNVNSTSVEAWKNILGIYNTQKTFFNGQEIDNEAVYPLIDPYGGKFDGQDIQNNEAFSGFRTLTNLEMDTLAKEIVKQVKLRGPFKSLSEFVNRKHDLNNPLPTSNQITRFDEAALNPHYMGALDAAIYQSKINQIFEDPISNRVHNRIHTSAAKRGNLYWPNPPLYPPHPEAGMGSIFQDIPAYFKQGDLLERLGSLLTTRSDTFVIRAYGEDINPITKNVTQSMCEAVVQRIPEGLESSSDSKFEPRQGSKFGRRYITTHFRWLGKKDL